MGIWGCKNYINCSEDDDDLDTIQIRKLKLIGDGAFGRVWAANIKEIKGTRLSDTGYNKHNPGTERLSKEKTVYAIKEMNKAIILAQGVDVLANWEVAILKMIPKCDFIVNLWEAFQDKNSAYLLMDYVPWGDLQFHMKTLNKQKRLQGLSGGTFTEDEARFIVVWILEALRVVHKSGIIHRDIKPDNIIMDSNGYAKLADFGVAELQKNTKKGNQFGTYSYMAPEIIYGDKYSYQADFYSLGVLLFLMVTGYMDVGNDISEAKNNISMRRKFLTTEQFCKLYPEISFEWNDLIVQLLAEYPSHRIGTNNGVDEILSHEWFSKIEIGQIKSQEIQSPIIDIVTNSKNIKKLTHVSDHAFENQWEK